MTVPPCTENVQWLVRRVAAPASADQVARFRQALRDLGEDGNWRIVMPFNQRPGTIVKLRYLHDIHCQTPLYTPYILLQ